MAGCGPPDTRSCVRAVSTMGPNRVWILILRSPALRTSNYSECLALPRKTPVSWRFSLVDRTRLTGNNLTPFCARQKKSSVYHRHLGITGRGRRAGGKPGGLERAAHRGLRGANALLELQQTAHLRVAVPALGPTENALVLLLEDLESLRWKVKAEA